MKTSGELMPRELLALLLLLVCLPEGSGGSGQAETEIEEQRMGFSHREINWNPKRN